jgi:hypothetical protein
MKKITLLFLLLIGFVSNAQTISHSTSLDLGTTNVACNAGAAPNNTSSDNRYFRFFNLSSFGITEDWAVQNVQFGIQSLNIPTLPGGFPITVVLYTTTATNFPTLYPTGYTELTQITTNFPTDAAGTLVTVELDAVVPAGSNLLVEIGYAAQEAGSLNRVFLSANDLGQSAPTYISSTACGILAPATMASINFPNAHFVLAVTGQTLSLGSNDLDKVSIYPNPTKGNVNIDLPATVYVESATITDITGKQMDVKLDANNSFSIAQFRNGVYILNIQTSEGVINKRIIKE